ncbi:GNAT family N-acetyltransferase [Vibrio ulleungensis]|uniref:GNAT family N-acetyltransferase n=1 Tax=Vibrio ulleungensis TaxID=2807619 RepID=A0ABS2HEL8_9VIBR|nr:GNAT family N-acetyltransferase [Vibrio ulleungensis]MBM7035531.1 GNAT family N-acetyltransferase [Vibrio ulleungensis]
MDIKSGVLRHPQIISLLEEHLSDMHATSPAESVHALDLTKLSTPDISFYSAWHEDTLLGCAAISQHCDKMAEIKSMRTTQASRNKGVAKALLNHLIETAKNRGYDELYLETGTMDYFKPARALYKSFGFTPCEPFADYQHDPNSTHMVLSLTKA